MTEIIFRRCNGGEKGELCKKLIERAYESFFGCGTKKIQNICNKRREKLIREWLSKNPNDPMSEYGLQIPFRLGIEEITPLFELNEPKAIEVYILEGVISQGNEGLAAMDIRPLNEELTRWKIHAYLDIMEHSDNNLQWRGFRESIEEITYHELLHACGDNPLMGKHDGILRHNLIGITTMKNCIDENSS